MGRRAGEGMKLSRATLLGMTILILIHLWRRYVGIRRVRRNIARLERALTPEASMADIYGVHSSSYGPYQLNHAPGAVWAVNDVADVRVLPANYTQIHADSFLEVFEKVRHV